ncbi:MAG: long-chain fatty acid--CoA ligase [Alphaproteobacteria bacterium]|nr:long-chain fatty acid--CoA ligase [Alphaproteobacteria bacterium]
MGEKLQQESWQNLPDMFFKQAEKYQKQKLLGYRHHNQWHTLSWEEIADSIKKLAGNLIQAGIKQGDRVAILSESRPEWLIADFAIMSAHAITVPIYITNTIKDHSYIVNHSNIKVAIISNEKLLKKFLPSLGQKNSLEFIILMNDTYSINPIEKVKIYSWKNFIEQKTTYQNKIQQLISQIKLDETCCFIYTSGTGGTPKAVMLSHKAILSNCESTYEILKDFGLNHEIFLSFLPLSHAYEHMAGQFFPLSIGAQIFYAENADKLGEAMLQVKPTIMTAVPRLYEILYERILHNLKKTSKIKQFLFHLTWNLGRKQYEYPNSLTWKEKLLNKILEKLIRNKVRNRFGGRLKVLVSGGAALNYEIGLFFTALGVRILQGYGQTEAAPVISVNPISKIKLHTVGLPLKDVEIKLAEDNEILVRGKSIMKGYWQDPIATNLALQNDWLHTGDIGQIDDEGYLSITDRKKDIIVLSGGETISPSRIESFISLEAEISQSMVYGDKHPYIVALIVPNSDYRKEFYEKNLLIENQTNIISEPLFIKAMGKVIEKINQNLSSVEKIRRFILISEEFTIENGLLTPSLKIKRHKILEKYKNNLEKLFT